MAWIRALSPDLTIEVVVDPLFKGNLINLALLHVTWAVTRREDDPRFFEAEAFALRNEIYELNRCLYLRDYTPDEYLIDILGVLDDHYYGYRYLNVRGIPFDSSLVARFSGEALVEFLDLSPDGFTARMDWGTRYLTLGR